MTRASAGKSYFSHLCDFSNLAQRFNNSVDPSFPNDVRCVTAFMVGLDKQPVDTDSFQASGLARFQESMNVHRGTGVTTESVPQ